MALNWSDWEKEVLTNLLWLSNTHVCGKSTFLVWFFQAQWVDQVGIALDHSKDSKEKVQGNLKMAQFWENEEILLSYQ
jgi:hypothetical protein